jgi:hypothetical protein
VQPLSIHTSEILPFSIRNQSVFFNMKDAVFTCNICSAAFSSDDGQWWFQVPKPPDPRCPLGGKLEAIKRIIRSRHFVNYACAESAGIRDVRINGRQMQFRSVMLRIGIDYDVDLILSEWHRHFISNIFTWVPTTDGHVWVEGDIIY